MAAEELGPSMLALEMEKGPESRNAVASTGCRKQRDGFFAGASGKK